MYMYVANYQHLTINLKDSIFQMSVYDQALLCLETSKYLFRSLHFASS